MKVLLNTNVLISCIGPRNSLRSIWNSFLEDRFLLVISIEIFFEYIEKLEEKTSISLANNISEVLRTSELAYIVNTWRRWRLIHIDPDDNKFLDITIAAEADYMITDDKHFNFVKRIGFIKTKIISPEEFLTVLNNL